MIKHSEKFLRKRKALLLFPLVAIPLLTLVFWAIGGGKDSNQATAQVQGINTSLPSAQLPAGSLDKMSLYDKAATDSQALKNQLGSNSFTMDTASHSQDSNNSKVQELPGQQLVTGSSGSSYSDPNEAKVQAKLDQLEQALNRPATPPARTNSLPGVNDPSADAQLKHLQQEMQQMNQPGEQDPEMQQMNGMLEKILDIQHPDRLKQQLKEQSLKNRGRVYPVSHPDDQYTASLVSRNSQPRFGNATMQQGFYDAEDKTLLDSLTRPAISAVVQETQTLVSGAAIKLRLTEDIMVNGLLIPKDNFVFGTCGVDGERLKVAITAIRYGKSLFPVSLSAYDLDALEGIRIPGAISRDASKEGADRAIQGVQLMSYDPSLGAQAASAGVEAAKGLLSKKVKLIRVTVKAGYPVLLMDEKAKQDNN